MPKGILNRAAGMQAILLAGVCVATIVGCSRELCAQAGTASIQGIVTDTTKAVIPGATIAVTNMETNLQRTATSNGAGLYEVPDLPPGRYRIQVSIAGFQTSVLEDIDLVVGQQLVLNTALRIARLRSR